MEPVNAVSFHHGRVASAMSLCRFFRPLKPLFEGSRRKGNALWGWCNAAEQLRTLHGTSSVGGGGGGEGGGGLSLQNSMKFGAGGASEPTMW